jgi:hypothetical protein
LTTQRPQGRATRPSIAVALVAALAGVLFTAGMPAASASSTVTVNHRVITNKVVAAGASYTMTLDSLPANAKTAMIVVGGKGAAARTKISACAGGVATAACKAAPQLTTPVSKAGYAHVVLNMAGAGKKVTLHNSSSKVSLTVRFAWYTVDGATAPASTPKPASGRPGPSNTGVPAGTKLTVHNGDLTITKANTVIDAMDIRGIVFVRAPGVVIKRSLITGRPTSTDLALVMVQKGSARIEDSELYAKHPNAHIRGVIGQNFTLLRADVHTVIDQMVITGDNVTVQHSWLHGNLHYAKDPNYQNKPSHDDNAQISIGKNLKFIGNTMEGTHNASLMVTQDRGPVRNLTFTGNYVANGGCAINLAQKKHGAMSGFVFRNNVFARNQIHKGCAMIVDKATAGLLTLGNNTWTDGKAISIVKR